jgi:cytochrome P450
MSSAQPTLRESSPQPVSRVYLPNESRLWGNIRVIAWNNLEFFQLCEKMAGIVETRAFLTSVFVVHEPSAIADVLVNSPNSFEKPVLLRRLKHLFGNGLLTTDGDLWKRNRHLLQPAFSAELLPAFLEIVQQNTLEMISRWREGEERDLYVDIAELCLKNVTQSLLGVYDDELDQLTRGLAETGHSLVEVVLGLEGLLPFLLPGKLKNDLKRQIKSLDEYLGRLFAQRAKEPPRHDFLGILLSPHNGNLDSQLARQAIRDHIITLLLAGHDTTASGLVWGIYLLSTHAECADKLAAELNSKMNGEAPGPRDVERLPYLRGTLDETLRLYPPIHRIGRTVKTPVTVGGHLLKKGNEVLIPQWSVHRSSRWYDRPGQFFPERWTPEFRRSLPRWAYFPFSGGPHTCVGANMAWSECAVIMSILAKRFRFTGCDEAPLEHSGGLTLVPGGGHFRVRIQMRERGATTAS